jgi:tRNA-specific 2-thiouridylase
MNNGRQRKPKVLCAMSGGVDSSVAAALLVKRGYDVTGAFMVNYQASPNKLSPTNSDGAFTGQSVAESCWRGDYQDALRVAAKLGIPLLRLDFTKEYKKMVLDYMYSEYKAGRTPNPDVLCNKFVKFGVWLDKAKKLGFDFLATGHYARIERTINNEPLTKQSGEAGRNLLVANCSLLISNDENKDQTYFLHQLSQAQLKHVLFPIGAYPKVRVRALAKKFNLPTADKEESMGICFIGEVPMKQFLMKKIKPKKGKIFLSPSFSPPQKGGESDVSPSSLSGGQIVGEHDGLAFYTIGERIAIQCHSEGVERPKNLLLNNKILRWAQDDNSKPFFVVDKNIRKNELIVGYENDPLLHKNEINVKDINWIAGRKPKFPLKCEVRLRHRQPLQDCQVIKSVKSKVHKVIFKKTQRAVTPGQFAVFYLKGECLGGGEIV